MIERRVGRPTRVVHSDDSGRRHRLSRRPRLDDALAVQPSTILKVPIPKTVPSVSAPQERDRDIARVLDLALNAYGSRHQHLGEPPLEEALAQPHPEDLDGIWVLLRTLESFGHREIAKRLARNSRGLSPDAVASLVRTVRVYLVSEQLPRLANFYSMPEDREAHYSLGHACARLPETQEVPAAVYGRAMRLLVREFSPEMEAKDVASAVATMEAGFEGRPLGTLPSAQDVSLRLSEVASYDLRALGRSMSADFSGRDLATRVGQQQVLTDIAKDLRRRAPKASDEAIERASKHVLSGVLDEQVSPLQPNPSAWAQESRPFLAENDGRQVPESFGELVLRWVGYFLIVGLVVELLDEPAPAQDIIDGVNSDDGNQAGIGNCGLHASLSVSVGAGRFDQSRLTFNADDTVTVRLYRREASADLRPFSVRITRDLPVDLMSSKNATGASELWPLFVVKAYAAAFGGGQYEARASGRGLSGVDALDALERLGGLPAYWVRCNSDRPKQSTPSRFRSMVKDVDGLWSRLQRELQNGRPVVIGNLRDPPSDVLHSHHVYSLVRLEEGGGKRWVVLRNPWGFPHPLVRVPIEVIDAAAGYYAFGLANADDTLPPEFDTPAFHAAQNAYRTYRVVDERFGRDNQTVIPERTP